MFNDVGLSAISVVGRIIYPKDIWSWVHFLSVFCNKRGGKTNGVTGFSALL